MESLLVEPLLVESLLVEDTVVASEFGGDSCPPSAFEVSTLELFMADGMKANGSLSG